MKNFILILMVFLFSSVVLAGDTKNKLKKVTEPEPEAVNLLDRKVSLYQECAKFTATLQEATVNSCLKELKPEICSKLKLEIRSVLISRMKRPGTMGICVLSNTDLNGEQRDSAFIFVFTEDKRWGFLPEDFF